MGLTLDRTMFLTIVTLLLTYLSAVDGQDIQSKIILRDIMTLIVAVFATVLTCTAARRLGKLVSPEFKPGKITTSLLQVGP